MENLHKVVLMDEDNACGCVLAPKVEDVDADAMRRTYLEMATLPLQTHSLNVEIAVPGAGYYPDTDALVTFTPDLPVGVVTADCVPILIYAPDVRGVAAVHAGWRGSLAGIVDRVIDLLESHGADTAQMKVTFGPSISAAMYEVSEELADQFRDAGFGEVISYPTGGKPHIDLQGVNIERLMRRGVCRERIVPSTQCTYSSTDSDGKPLYQSHRRSHGGQGRNLTMITLSGEESGRNH